MIKNFIIYCLGLCILLSLTGCETEGPYGSKWELGEVEAIGIELTTKNEKYPLKMYATVPASGISFKLIPEEAMRGFPYCEVENFHVFSRSNINSEEESSDSDINLFEPIGTNFIPALSMGGKWYGACEWMWIEYLKTGEGKDLIPICEFMVYIDKNSTGESRSFTLAFTGAYINRDIVITQEAE